MTDTISLADAQAKLDALMAAQASDTLSVSFGGRSVTYRSMQEISQQITYWARVVTELKRTAKGAPRHGYSVADFRRRT